MKISASFLSINNNFKENISILDQTNIDYLHLDIMDGKFVPNKTWNFKEIETLLQNTTKPKDVHLMVKNVKKYVKQFQKLKPEYITFHLETSRNCFDIIRLIKKYGIKVGMSIKPNTKVEELKPYLPYLDLVLVMSVEPGKGGQSFIDNSFNKIKELDNLRQENNYQYLIEVDGGINDTNITLLKQSNVDIIVVGSFITNSNNYQEQIEKLLTN